MLSVLTESRSGRWHFLIQEYSGEDATSIAPIRFRCCQDGRCPGFPSEDAAMRAGKTFKALFEETSSWDIPSKACALWQYLAKQYPDEEVVPVPYASSAGGIKIQMYLAGRAHDVRVSRKFLNDHDADGMRDFFVYHDLISVIAAAGEKPVYINNRISVLE